MLDFFEWCLDMFGAAIAIVLVALVIVIAYQIEAMQCRSRFAEWQPTYSLIEGCMITVRGKHMPATALRETP